MSREERLTDVFVELADTLVADFDVIDFLGVLTHRCVDLLGAAAAGILLADRSGQLRVSAASSEPARLVGLFELQNNEGPSLECFATATEVGEADLETALARWPGFAPQALAAGFRSVHAVPLRLRDEVIGALSLFGAAADSVSPEARRLGQAMADVASIGILQERAIRRAEVLAEQLQSALNSRVIIEQAKGVLAERAAIDMDRAFLVLRGYARSNRIRLADLARQVVDGTIDAAPLLGGAPPATGPAPAPAAAPH